MEPMHWWRWIVLDSNGENKYTITIILQQQSFILILYVFLCVFQWGKWYNWSGKQFEFHLAVLILTFAGKCLSWHFPILSSDKMSMALRVMMFTRSVCVRTTEQTTFL